MLVATAALALVFSLEGSLRLARLDFYVLRFAIWGYPPWMVWVVSLGEIAGAVMLLWRETFTMGAAILGLICAGLVTTHLASGDGRVVLVPLAMLAALAGLVALRRAAPGRG